MYTYTPTKEEPQFIRYSAIRSNEHLTLEEYEAWQATLPDSPVDPAIRMVVRGAYQTQHSRIVTGNRLFAHFRIKLGLEPSDKEEAEANAKKVLEDLEKSYRLITEGCAKELPTMNRFKGHGLISEYAELLLVSSFLKLHAEEKAQFSRLKNLIKGIPLQDYFFENVGGCGPGLGAFLLAELNPYRAPNASSFVRYMGLDVTEEGFGRGHYKSHMEPKWMRVRKGEDYELERVTNRTYDGKKKSRLVETGMDCVLKAGLKWLTVTDEEFDASPAHLRRLTKDGFKQRSLSTCPYALAYLGYRHRLQNEERDITGRPGLTWKDTSDGHRHKAARRYMAKLFLRDMWLAWRMLEGLPVTEPYEVAYLGRRPHHEPAVHLMPVLKYLESQGTVTLHNTPKPASVYTGNLDLDGGCDGDPLVD